MRLLGIHIEDRPTRLLLTPEQSSSVSEGKFLAAALLLSFEELISELQAFARLDGSVVSKGSYTMLLVRN